MPEERFTTPEYNISDNNNNSTATTTNNNNNNNNTDSNSSREDSQNVSQKTTSENVSIHDVEILNQTGLKNSSLANDTKSFMFNSTFVINNSSNLIQEENGSTKTSVPSASYEQKFNISLLPSNQSAILVNLTESVNSSQDNLTTNSSLIYHSNNFTNASSSQHLQTIDFFSLIDISSGENSSLNNATNELNIHKTSLIILSTTSPNNGSVSNTTTTTTTTTINTTTTTPPINFDELGTYNITVPEKTLIIVAYRNREENRKVFIPEMNKYLTNKVN